MVPQLIARVDGLPVSLLDREVVWPVPDARRDRRGLSRAAARPDRAPDRRGARVPAAGVGTGAGRAAKADAERVEIRAELARGGAAVNARPSQPSRVGGNDADPRRLCPRPARAAAAVLAVAVAVRLLVSPTRDVLARRGRRCRRSRTVALR